MKKVLVADDKPEERDTLGVVLARYSTEITEGFVISTQCLTDI